MNSISSSTKPASFTAAAADSELIPDLTSTLTVSVLLTVLSAAFEVLLSASVLFLSEVFLSALFEVVSADLSSDVFESVSDVLAVLSSAVFESVLLFESVSDALTDLSSTVFESELLFESVSDALTVLSSAVFESELSFESVSDVFAES